MYTLKDKHDSDKEELEGNDQSIDVALQPLSESTPIKPLKEAPIEFFESSPEKEISMEETEDKVPSL